MNIAKQILLSSVISVLLVLGILYSARAYIHQYFVPDTVTVSPVGDVSTTQTSLPDMIERVNRGVVSVIATKDVPTYERYYESYNPFGDWFGGFSVPRVRENGSTEQEVGGGSGFVVSADGLIVTNRHVVADDEARYSVITGDGSSYEVEVLAKDVVLDIAVLRMKDMPEDMVVLTFGDSDAVRLGETVVAIGNALAEFRNSVSVGIISGLSRSIEARDGRGMTEQLSNVFQTDAAINPGNSGGPLLNEAGQVIGVNVAASVGAENIGFAIPSAAVASIVSSVQEYGEIRRPFLGVRYAMVTDRMQKANNLSVDYGAVIVRGTTPEELAVMPGSPADIAGLRENDIILSVDGDELRDVDLASVLRTKNVGDVLTLEIVSGDTRKTVSVTLTLSPTE